jgi:hypothetical protein
MGGPSTSGDGQESSDPLATVRPTGRVSRGMPTGELSMPEGDDPYRRPVPIPHPCDGSDTAHCECAKARQRERRRERRRERVAAEQEARRERQAQKWAEQPRPRPRKVDMYPLVHTCDGTQPKRCECYRAWMREYQRRRRAGSGRSSEENRRFNLWRLYGVTPEEVEALRVAQDYRCAICGRHEDEPALQRLQRRAGVLRGRCGADARCGCLAGSATWRPPIRHVMSGSGAEQPQAS